MKKEAGEEVRGGDGEQHGRGRVGTAACADGDGHRDRTTPLRWQFQGAQKKKAVEPASANPAAAPKVKTEGKENGKAVAKPGKDGGKAAAGTKVEVKAEREKKEFDMPGQTRETPPEVRPCMLMR